jgi:hypothetical protein
VRKFALPVSVLSATMALFVTAAPANAQASRTWVSGVGDDANPCSRTAPCKTYAGAISKTAAGGEINCLDPGGFGAVTITKSISIVCDYTEGGVLAASTHGFTINMSASGNIVTLKGQDVECFITGINGVRILNAFDVTVHVHKSQFRNCRGGGSGISVTNSAGKVELFVKDTYITGNGTSGTTGGIVVAPTGSGAVVLDVDRVRLEDNSAGIIVSGSTSSGVQKALIRDSQVSGNTNNGITASSAGSNVTVMVQNVGVSANANGLVASGSGAGMLVSGSAVTGNTTAVSATAPATILCYGDNLMNGNTGGEACSAGSPIGKK